MHWSLFIQEHVDQYWGMSMIVPENRAWAEMALIMRIMTIEDLYGET